MTPSPDVPRTPQLSAVPADDAPFPPRYWWLRRLTLASLAFVAFFWGVRAHVGRRVDALLRAEVDAGHARGEPVLIEDFDEPPVPDEQNAAFHLRRAVKTIDEALARRATASGQSAGYYDPQFDPQWKPNRRVSTTALSAPPLSAPPLTFPLVSAPAASFLDDNAAAFADTRLARECPRVAWNLNYVHPVVMTLLPDLNGQRTLANVLADRAALEHQRGDDAAAVETLRDLLFCARAIDRQPFLVGHLVALGIDNKTSMLVAALSPDLAAGPGEGAAAAPSASTNPAARPAGRGAVRALIADLLDDRPLREANGRAIHGERMMQVDTAEAIARGDVEGMGAFAGVRPGFGDDSPLQRLALRAVAPAIRREAVDMARYATAQAGAFAAPDARSAAAVLPPTASRPAGVVARMILPSLDRALATHFNVLNARRTAAVALAARLFEIDHGRKPASLDELVPAYLPSVPEDARVGAGSAVPNGLGTGK